MGVGLYHIGYWMIIGALGFIACSKLLDAVVKRWTLRQISPFLSQVESIMTKERSRIESIVGGKVPSLERIKSSKFIPQIFVLPKEPKEYQIRTLYKVYGPKRLAFVEVFGKPSRDLFHPSEKPTDWVIQEIYLRSMNVSNGSPDFDYQSDLLFSNKK
eukprot:TRINITY_DN2313_c0_g3_i1.p1 TRINITY_DN2313_c0_g3~~TRINITY_DN2313_c0_g3_i1.p1  ORF type:complete len:158 (-),score=8.76 TRINITY_DN2313_c0_g3_i1:172-645(-)